MSLQDQSPIFVSYGNTPETAAFVKRLHDDLEREGISMWLDQRDIDPADKWDDKIEQGLIQSRAMVAVITSKSLASDVCKDEWNHALSARKPIIPILVEAGLGYGNLPFRLARREGIDFRGDYEQAIAALRAIIRRWDTLEGKIAEKEHLLSELLTDQKPSDTPERFTVQIREVTEDIERIKAQLRDPEGTAKQAEDSRKAAIERERERIRRAAEQRQQKTFERIVGRAPQDVKDTFKDRPKERAEISNGLTDPKARLVVVVGQGGIGKTALACYILNGLESAYDSIAGLIYLSAGTGGIDLERIFINAGRMTGQEKDLIAVYNNPDWNLPTRIQKLLECLHRDDEKRYILLLDNLETYQQDENGELRDKDLAEFLHRIAIQPSALRVLVTTRVPLKLKYDAMAHLIPVRMNEGLPPEDAVQFLRELDLDGGAGLRDLPPTDQRVYELAKRLKGYPRALQAIVGRLRFDSYLTLDDLLAQSELLTDEIVEDMVRGALKNLEPEAMRVMEALAVFERPVPAVAVEELLQSWQDVMTTRAALKRLVENHFVSYEKASGTHALHPIDRVYAYSHIPLRAESKPDPVNLTEDTSELSPVELLARILAEAEQKKNKPLTYDRITLHDRAADYFRRLRQPQEKWKTINDLEPQLAEFEQRISAGDYDEAARIVGEIDFHYLILWGHSAKVLAMRERLLGKLSGRLEQNNCGILEIINRQIGRVREGIKHGDRALQLAREQNDRGGEGAWLGNLGNASYSLGEVRKAIEYYEQALAIAREIGDRHGEGNRLGNLGIAYSSLGEVWKAIEYHEQALVIFRKIETKAIGEPEVLQNLGDLYLARHEIGKAIDHYEQASTIANQMGFVKMQNYSQYGLAKANLFNSNITLAYRTADRATQFDVPENNHSISAILGIIILQQGDYPAAKTAFEKAIKQADDFLSKNDRSYNALYAKALALSGLSICKDIPQSPEIYGQQAIATYQHARSIFDGAGIILDNVQLFEALMQAPGGEALAGVLAVLKGERPKYKLDDLLKGITDENRHDETDWGSATGKEIW